MLRLSARLQGPPEGEEIAGRSSRKLCMCELVRVLAPEVPKASTGLSAGVAGPPEGEEGAVRRAAGHQPQRASRHAHPKPLEVAALTISDAVLCSEMGVHFSPCGRLLAACVACQVSALTTTNMRKQAAPIWQHGRSHLLIPDVEACAV